MRRRQFLIFMLLLLVFLTPVYNASAELVKTSEVTLEDSEEPFSRRIYSYDFDITPSGTVHAVYAKPVPNENRTQIIYTSKQVGGDWPSSGNRIILEDHGLLGSISTFLIYDNKSDTVHICYIVDKPFVDQDGVTHTSGLVYQTIKNGIPGPEINVSPGSFHSRMQLDANGKPLFAREYEVFLNPDGTIGTPPYPKALRVLIPSTTKNNQWTQTVLNLPAAPDYRLAGFVYDTAHKRGHILYGDHNAVYLRNTYPTVNPPVTPDKTPVYFPPGSGHKLWHAYSDNITTWTASLVDGSGNISENEFWTDLIVDGKGTPWAASYTYATDAQGVQEGTYNIIGNLKSDNTWDMEKVEGKTTGASPSRAGMGSKLLIDSAGSFHGVWDDSPDKPIDAEGAGGNVMYRFSPDGKNWAVRQAILPYSAEGQCRVKFYGDKLFLMVLGDFRDARLVFAEYQVPAPTDNLIEISTDKMFYAPGETIDIHAWLQGNAVGDYYILAIGPFNIDPSTGAIQYIPTTQSTYLGPDFTWHPVQDLFQAKPVFTNTLLFSYDADFLFPVAKVTPPFNYPSRYAFISFLNKTGSPLATLDFLTPIYLYYMHLCSQNGCAEL